MNGQILCRDCDLYVVEIDKLKAELATATARAETYKTIAAGKEKQLAAEKLKKRPWSEKFSEEVFTGQVKEIERLAKLVQEERKAREEAESELDALREDGVRLDWLEQHQWRDADHCLSFVDSWRDDAGKRHPQGLRAAIDATRKEGE